VDKSLPLWLARGLGLPGWKLLAIQWLVLGSLILLFGLSLLQGKWQQLTQTEAQQQRLMQQMTPLWEQLARMPTLDQVNQSLQQVTRPPAADSDLASTLQRAGAGLQRWQQQQGDSPRQTLMLHLNYGSLLRLLERFPAQLRIVQMTVEAQSGELTAHFILQAVLAEAEAANPNE
jgi:pilus assembly protein HofO